MAQIEIDELRKYVEFNRETGKLVWLPRKGNPYFNGRHAGQVAGEQIGKYGYRKLTIHGNFLLTHRVILALVNGEWPNGDVDHVDRNRANNDLSNLRISTRSENHRNKGKQKNNTSGYKGVSFNKKCGKWQASVGLHNCSGYLGLFNCPTVAALIRDNAAIIRHGEFADLNFKGKRA